jgi:hypothetical protein
MTEVQPPLTFIPPSFNPLVLKFAKIILPWYLKFQTNISTIEGENLDTFRELYQRFAAQKIRLLFAFRHPSTNDPLCMAHLFWHLAENYARNQGFKFKIPIHAHFMYDRGIPLWAGDWVGWLYAHLGGSSIQRGKLDLLGLKSARNLFVNGTFPLAAAPEGATNGHNEIMSPLEPGIAQLGFWCVDDLLKAQRQEEVIFLPIGIKYNFLESPWRAIANLLTELEQEAGIETKQPLKLSSNKISEAEKEILYQRLFRLGEALLAEMEHFYHKFYHQPLESINQDAQENQRETQPNKLFAQRLRRLLDTALKVAEGYFNIKAKGDLTDRCRRLEQAGWDYIYREDFKDSEQKSTVERGLANHLAEEATMAMWHMRLVESFVSVTGSYVKENLSGERFAETLMIIWDLITRLKGGNPFLRPLLGKQRVKLTMGEAISVSSRWGDYQKNRRQAIASLTQDLQLALAKML